MESRTISSTEIEMTDEFSFSSCNDQAKVILLREAVDRADTLASFQAKLISTQESLIEMLQKKNKSLESEINELKTFLQFPNERN